VPEPKQLLALQREAEAAGRNDLAEVFQRASLRSLGLSMDEGIFATADQFETIAVAMLLSWIRSRNPAARVLIKQIASGLANTVEEEEFVAEAARRGFIDTTPRREKK
jgi:hypothetical protein